MMEAKDSSQNVLLLKNGCNEDYGELAGYWARARHMARPCPLPHRG